MSILIPSDMSAQIVGEKLAAPIPQALSAREFMIERLILVSVDDLTCSSRRHHRRSFHRSARQYSRTFTPIRSTRRRDRT